MASSEPTWGTGGVGYVPCATGQPAGLLSTPSGGQNRVGGTAHLLGQITLTPAYIGNLEVPNISKALSLDTLFDITAVLVVESQKFLAFED